MRIIIHASVSLPLLTTESVRYHLCKSATDREHWLRSTVINNSTNVVIVVLSTKAILYSTGGSKLRRQTTMLVDDCRCLTENSDVSVFIVLIPLMARCINNIF